MHNALRWFLLWVLFPFVIVAADPPPPLVRSVLSTNLPPFGLTGQALFRTANLPYLDWSNIVQQVIDTNAFQPASANLTNWSLISTNALTGKLDSNVWWAAWGSLDTNALTGKLDSNYWFTVWGAIATNALTAKLDSNWWWTAYGGKVLTNGGAFIGSQTGFGTNTTFRSSANTTVPLVISNQIGSTTNTFEAVGTNGITGKSVVISSRGFVGINTNLPQAPLHVTGTNGPSQYIVQVENPMVAGQTNLILVGTNGGINFQEGGDHFPVTYGVFDCGMSSRFYGGNSPTSGEGLEVTYSGGIGYFTSFDRSGSAWKPFNLRGSYVATLANNHEQLRVIDGSVEVGTNGATVNAKLDVIGDNSVANILRAGTTNRPTLLVLTTNGYLGIGTNTPQCPLHITGTNGPSPYIVQVENPMVAGATNLIVVATNNRVGVLCNPDVGKMQIGTRTGVYTATAGNGLIVYGASSTFGQIGVYTTDAAAADKGGFFQFGGENTVSGGATSPYAYAGLGGKKEGSGADYSGYLNFYTTAANSAFTEQARITSIGNFGIGTNGPIARLDIIGNNAQDVLRAGTTNRPTLMTLTTNGVLSVNPGGGLNPVGCYGALMMNATNIVVCAGAASVYTNIAGTGYTTIVTNGFYGDTNGNSSALTNLYAGYYRVQASVSYVGANAGAYEAEIFTNNVSCDLIGWKDTFDTPARLRNGGAAGIIYLPAGCRTSVRIQDGGAGTSIAIQRTSLVIGTP